MSNPADPGPTIEGESAKPRGALSPSREMLVAGRDPRNDATVPTGRRRKVGPLTAGLATLFVLAGAYTMRDEIKNAFHGNSVENTVSGDTASGQSIRAGATGLAAIYDDKLIIRFDPQTKAVTRAPLYADMERLAGELNRTADFQRYARLMEDVWIGRMLGTGRLTGGIYTENLNPEGTLAGFGRTNTFALTGQVRQLEDITRNYLDQLRNSPGFAAAIGNHPDLKSFMDSEPQRLRLYAMANGQPVPDLNAARSVVANDPAMRGMNTLLPTDASTPSTAYLTLRSVTQALNLRSPGMNIDVNPLSTALSGATTDRKALCALATQWERADAKIRGYQHYAAAVADVQRAEDAKGSGLNVQRTLDNARDISAASARGLQRAYGPSCGL